jgi:tetratricopeptide (TPR) repeat protein
MLRRVSLALAITALAAAPALAQHDHHAGPAAGSGAAPLLEGLGQVHFEVKTRVPLAQKYFDQGLRLAYGFNHEEAKRAFLEAARLDSTCAMAWWGAALVLGPNINLPMSPEAETEAYRYAQRALACAPAAPVERGMVDALAKRYDATGGMNRAAHDSAYADAMRALHKANPADPDIATLTAESLMDLRPVGLLGHGRKAQPGTMEIVSILEGVLKVAPGSHRSDPPLHPRRRGVARAGARREIRGQAGHARPERGAPGAHAQPHPPARGALCGRGRLQRQSDHGGSRLHREVQPARACTRSCTTRTTSTCAGRRSSPRGAGRTRSRPARDIEKAVPDSIVTAMPMAEFLRVAPYLTQARFGLWEEALKEPAPPPGMPFQRGAWHYARGMAYAAGGKYTEAQAERDSVLAVANALPPDSYFSLNPAAPVYRFAAAHLAGEIALRRGNNDEAIQLLQTAAGMQDSLHYDEPPAWQQTARQSLGAALLTAGRAADAEAVYREDLARYPETGWSLYGLTQALRAEGKTKEAAETEKRFGARGRNRTRSSWDRGSELKR